MTRSDRHGRPSYPNEADASADRWPLLLLVVLLVAVALFRAPILFDDRTWDDENAVLLQGNALYAAPLPGVFRGEDLRRDPSLGDVLSSVRSGAYPPAMAVTVFLFRGTPSPVRALRIVLFAAGLALLALTYATARTAGDGWLALLATLYVASSTLLTHSSQQIKWNAVAPIVSLVACSLLLRPRPAEGGRVRPWYVLAIALLLHIHYFCLWILPAHLLWLAVMDRPRLRRGILECALALTLAAPWYLYALPRQLGFVQGHFDAVSHRAVDAWNAPLGLVSAARALGYDVLVGLGMLPSPFKGRMFAPILLVALFVLGRGSASAIPGRRRLATLALSGFGTAVVAQTLYAIRVGNVVPLQPHYLSPWIPLLMIAVVVGGAEIASRGARVAVVGTILSLSVATLGSMPMAGPVLESPLPRDYRQVCGAVRRADPGTAVVHQSQAGARLLNLACRIDGWQAVGTSGMETLTADVTRALMIDGCEHPAVPAAGWRAVRPGSCFANTKLTEYVRQAPVVASGSDVSAR